MADLTITAANVKPSAQATIVLVTLGATATAGQVVYKAANTKYSPARANAAATAEPAGILCSGGGLDQRVPLIVKDPDLEIGATVAEATLLAVSAAAAGGIAPPEDITTEDHLLRVFGVAKASNKVDVDFSRVLAATIPA